MLSGALQTLCVVTLVLDVFFKGKSIFVSILKKIFFSKIFGWYCYLFIAPNLNIFATGLKCSEFLNFLVSREIPEIGKLLENDFGNRNAVYNTLDPFWREVLALPCFLFMLSAALNYYIFTTMSVSRRIKNNKYGFRKNTDPELFLLAYYFINALFYKYGENRDLGYVTTIVCFSLGFATSFTKSSFGNSLVSFISSLQFSTCFWISLFGLFQDIYPSVLKNSLAVALITYACFIIVTLLLKSDDSYLNKLYNPIVRFKDDEEMIVLDMIESLNIMLIDSKNDSKMMIYMCGYITRFQEVNDSNVESVISFRRLLDYKDYLPPKRYRENMEKGFVKHIGERYIEAIYRYPKSPQLRISFAYFLNDYMQMRNSALEMMKSTEYFSKKSFILGYQHFQLK